MDAFNYRCHSAYDSETPLERQVQKHMKHAIIETGGKQYRVSEGDTIFIEKLESQTGDNIIFDKVLAVVDSDITKFGTPLLAGAKVSASVLKNGKAKKVRIFKMKRRKGYRRRQGHRQPYTQVKIETISA